MKGKFTMAIGIFYYLPLQINYHFPFKKFESIGVRGILVFSQDPLIIKELTRDVYIFLIFLSIVK